MRSSAGYQWLAQRYGVDVVQPLRVVSEIGTVRQSRVADGFALEIYPPSYRPDDTLAGHLTFALKYEGVFPEFLSRLFDRVPETEVASWVNAERVGQYSRRIGFLWEWIAGRELTGVAPVPSGNYVDAVDGSKQMVASTGANNPRWRVRDNLPGTRDFCPLVINTPEVAAAADYDCASDLEAMNIEFGADVLMRSAVWLTLKESRSSFMIEREERKADHIRRFATAMERYCGTEPDPLAVNALAALQREIIGDQSTLVSFGLRQSPVFVGSHARYENVVHYVAPHWDAVPAMLKGLSSFLEKTKGAPSIVRAAAAAFGFVYIHPLADGNGRIHRFLINDILRRDGAVPNPYILPISATITNSPADRAKYDEILDVFSKPFMRKYSGVCEFTQRHEHHDGVESDFVFAAYADAAPAWRYPDLTTHVEYMAGIIRRTIGQEMTNEAKWMRDWDNARRGVKQIVEGPNQDIDRIIRSIKENDGAVSNAIKKAFPVLNDERVALDVVDVVLAAFRGDQPQPSEKF